MAFSSSVAWITGASSGIGAALARELAALGANIILSARDRARLEAVAADIPTDTLILPFEVRDDAAMAEATRQAIAWKGGVDIAIANAGISQRSRALKTDMQVYRDIIAIDLTQPNGTTVTRSIGEWRRSIPQLGKRPAVFIIGSAAR